MAAGTPRTDPLITVKEDVTSTEVSHNLREYTRGFQITCNSLVDIRIAFVSTGTGASGAHFVLRAGAYYWEEDIFFGGAVQTIYLNVPSGTADIAILEWK